MRTDLPTDTTVQEFFLHHVIGSREKAVAVVDGSRYLGIMGIEELHAPTSR